MSKKSYKSTNAINGYKKIEKIEIWDLDPMFWPRPKQATKEIEDKEQTRLNV